MGRKKKYSKEKWDEVVSTFGSRNMTIKTTLGSRLREDRLAIEIENWVNTVSIVTNKGSLVFNLMLHYCMHNHLPQEWWPDLQNPSTYYQCFTVGIEGTETPHPEIQAVWSEYFSQFPVTERVRGATTAYRYASDKYMTAVHNYFQENFERRQEASVRRWLLEYGYLKEYCYAIRCAINGWSNGSDVPEFAHQFVWNHRALLQHPPNGVTKQWIRGNISIVAAYFGHALNFMTQFDDAKCFNIAPIASIGCSHITIDTRVLFNMMRNVGLLEDLMDFAGDPKTAERIFRECEDEYFRDVFDLRCLGTTTAKFDYYLETYGYSAPFLFKKTFEETNESEGMKSCTPARSIAVDPGRVNIVYGVEELENGEFKVYSLTRAEYYNRSGINAFNRKAKRWQKEIESLEQQYAQYSTKTNNLMEWRNFLTNYIEIYDYLWCAKTQKKWRRWKFRVYCLKRKTLDRFFQSMNGDVKPVIAYGAATFGPNGRGELSVPTTTVAKTCSRHFKTIMIDEFKTSQVCPRCYNRIQRVKRVLDGNRIREVRGLRRCCSAECSHISFKNRDKIGALNILRCFKATC